MLLKESKRLFRGGVAAHYRPPVGQLLHRVVEERAAVVEESAGDLFMIGNCDSAVWRICVANHDVGASLLVPSVSGLAECLHDFSPGKQWKAHTVTSTNSSEMEGGTGSPCFWRLSI